MSPPSSVEVLPLRSVTPPGWAHQVLRQPLALLSDHAHLEKKAAANALELLNRWPEGSSATLRPQHWVATMTSVARDEIEHLAIVTRLLSSRGGVLAKSHHNRYAAALRSLVRYGHGTRELMDRLMISALIELRSCERFEILSTQCDDSELADLYSSLHTSERGHYLVFLNLARELAPDEAEHRWDTMLEAEASIMRAQPAGTGIHSG